MKRAVCISYIIIQLITVSLLLFAAGSTDYYIKRDQLYSNLVYLGAGLIASILFLLLVKVFRNRISVFLSRYERIAVPLVIGAFFFLSSVLCISGFFYSDWDPAAILGAVYDLLKGRSEEVAVTYFSNHPNNLLLVWVYLSVMKLNGIFGADSVLCLVVFQCFLAALSAFLFYGIIKELSGGNYVVSFTGLILFELWTGLSPWFIITYSDEVGMIFPLLILRCFMEAEKAGSGKGAEILFSVLMGALAAFGYYIKPQIVIAFAAALMVLFTSDRGGSYRKKGVALIAALLAAMICTAGIRLAIIPSLGIDTDSDRSFGMTHYLMMGLNPETDGVYSDEDTEYTDSFETPEEKQQADIRIAKERIAGYGFWGLLEHIKKKILVNYNDGLFAWGVDGHFFAGREAEDIGNVPSNFLTIPVWSFIMPDGSNHGKYSAAAQISWLTVLFMGLLCGIIVLEGTFRKSGGAFQSGALYVLMLSLTGLFIFELLFEAKARYLFSYTPYYLMAALVPAGAFLSKGK